MKVNKCFLEIIINIRFMERVIFINKYKGIVEGEMRATNFRLKFIILVHLIIVFDG